MIDETELLRTMRELRRETLHVWIERGWLSPVREDGDFRFRDIDVARARLIEEFRRDLALGDDALDVVLPLIDQLHGLRRELRRMAEAVSAEPDEVRQRIAAALRR
jgi:chaperone modulatory protein CbpM